MSILYILDRINSHNDLLQLNDQERTELCQEIREFLIDNVSRTGGHLAGNLGIVELSVAIETVYNTMEDRLVFDVGHQSYVHKLLTGRRADFSGLRQFGGLSGFPKPSESDADAFVAGHASSSVSIALGMARARSLQKKDYDVVAVIGDGACTGGMAYEGLNDAAVSGEPMVVILNDNEMSISRNVGGISRYLSRLRSSDNYLGAKKVYRELVKKLPGGACIYQSTSNLKNRVKQFLLKTSIFENMGFTYLGPADGHDLPGLISLLTAAKELREPVLVHVVTKKGTGYPFAEQDPAKFHGIGKFDPKTGNVLAPKVTSYSDVFGKTLAELAKQNEKLCAITAAMPSGTGLTNFQKAFPERTFDVGIAEEHAISMAGGLAKQGMTPVVALYSTFLQRGYDQILQDIALLQLHVVLAIDRAGLVGDDGPTHHGVFDVGFLRQVPGMKILTPVSLAEQADMLRWAIGNWHGPVAIRYPRGTEGNYKESDWNGLEGSLVKCHRTGANVTLVTYGNLLDNVLAAAQILAEEGIEATVLRMLTASDLAADQVLSQMSENHTVIVVEEVCSGSGIREALSWELHHLDASCRVYGVDLGRNFISHGSVKELHHSCGLDAAGIAEYTKEVLSR